jgi:hypothetical protein
VATSATISTTKPTIPNTTGSRGDVRNKSGATKRPAARAIATPIAPPTSTICSPSDTTSDRAVERSRKRLVRMLALRRSWPERVL